VAKKALLRGHAGNFYSIRGAIWELGSFAYRAYLHLIPVHSTHSRWVVSADGMSVREVLGAAKARVRSVVGTKVSALEVVQNKVAVPRPNRDPLGRVSRRYPPPTD